MAHYMLKFLNLITSQTSTLFYFILESIVQSLVLCVDGYSSVLDLSVYYPKEDLMCFEVSLDVSVSYVPAISCRLWTETHNVQGTFGFEKVEIVTWRERHCSTQARTLIKEMKNNGNVDFYIYPLNFCAAWFLTFRRFSVMRGFSHR